MLIKGDKKKEFGEVQFYVDREIAVGGAEEIVSVIADARLSAVEAMEREAKVLYKLTYKVIYRSEEGLKCQEATFDVSTMVSSAFLTPKSYVDPDLTVVANEYVGTDPVKVRSTIEIKGFIIVPESFETAEIPEDAAVLVRTEEVGVERIEAVKESEIVVTNEVDVKEGIDTVLTYDTQIILKSVSTATEICIVSGECYTYLTYLSGGSLLSRCVVSPFEGEILAPGVGESDRAFLKGVARATTVTLPEGAGSTKFRLELVVGIRGFVVKEEICRVVADAYSTKSELVCDYAEVSVEDHVCLSGQSEKLTGSVTLEDDAPRIRSVLCVCPPTVGAIGVSVENGEVTAEGIVAADVIYLDADERTVKTLVEIPYRFTLAREFDCDAGVSARTCVVSMTARARHNDEIELSGEMYFEVYGAKEKPLRYLQTVEVAGEREADDVAISLYIAAPGETLWDVAKALVTDEDTLTELNPELELPLKGGEKILLYRSI